MKLVFVKFLAVAALSFVVSVAQAQTVPSYLSDWGPVPAPILTYVCEVSNSVDHGELLFQDVHMPEMMMHAGHFNRITRRANIVYMDMNLEKFNHDIEKMEKAVARRCLKLLSNRSKNHCNSFLINRNKLSDDTYIHVPDDLLPTKLTAKPLMSSSTVRLYRLEKRHDVGAELMRTDFLVDQLDPLTGEKLPYSQRIRSKTLQTQCPYTEGMEPVVQEHIE